MIKITGWFPKARREKFYLILSDWLKKENAFEDDEILGLRADCKESVESNARDLKKNQMTGGTKMIVYLIDTNVFIAVLKGNAKLKTLIENFACVLNTVVYVGLIQDAKNKAETRKIEKYLRRFELIHFDEEISRKAIELIRTYTKVMDCF